MLRDNLSCIVEEVEDPLFFSIFVFHKEERADIEEHSPQSPFPFVCIFFVILRFFAPCIVDRGTTICLVPSVH